MMMKLSGTSAAAKGARPRVAMISPPCTRRACQSRCRASIVTAAAVCNETISPSYAVNGRGVGHVGQTTTIAAATALSIAAAAAVVPPTTPLGLAALAAVGALAGRAGHAMTDGIASSSRQLRHEGDAGLLRAAAPHTVSTGRRVMQAAIAPEGQMPTLRANGAVGGGFGGEALHATLMQPTAYSARGHASSGATRETAALAAAASAARMRLMAHAERARVEVMALMTDGSSTGRLVPLLHAVAAVTPAGNNGSGGGRALGRRSVGMAAAVAAAVRPFATAAAVPSAAVNRGGVLLPPLQATARDSGGESDISSQDRSPSQQEIPASVPPASEEATTGGPSAPGGMPHKDGPVLSPLEEELCIGGGAGATNAASGAPGAPELGGAAAAAGGYSGRDLADGGGGDDQEEGAGAALREWAAPRPGEDEEGLGFAGRRGGARED